MLKKLMSKPFSVLAFLAMALAIASVEQLCFFFYHQPDVPESLRKYES